MTSQNLYFGFLGRLGQAIDDGLGGVGQGKHATIRFRLKFDPTGLEPIDGLGGAKAGEGADEGATAAGVAGGEFAGVETGVSDIAATSAGETDFGEQVGTFFKEDDLGLGVGFRGGNGGEKPGGAAPGDEDSG